MTEPNEPVHLPPEIEQALADMSDEDFALLVMRVRAPDEPVDPKQRAANALRKERGADRNGAKATKEQAAAALRAHGSNAK